MRIYLHLEELLYGMFVGLLVTYRSGYCEEQDLWSESSITENAQFRQSNEASKTQSITKESSQNYDYKLEATSSASSNLRYSGTQRSQTAGNQSSDNLSRITILSEYLSTQFIEDSTVKSLQQNLSLKSTATLLDYISKTLPSEVNQTSYSTIEVLSQINATITKVLNISTVHISISNLPSTTADYPTADTNRVESINMNTESTTVSTWNTETYSFDGTTQEFFDKNLYGHIERFRWMWIIIVLVIVLGGTLVLLVQYYCHRWPVPKTVVPGRNV